MKLGITVLLFILSGVSWAADIQYAYPAENYYSTPYYNYQNTYYQNTYSQPAYSQPTYYAAPVYPAQNQYGYYNPPVYQQPVYQNPYAYANYYQAPVPYSYPVQEQTYAPANNSTQNPGLISAFPKELKKESKKSSAVKPEIKTKRTAKVPKKTNKKYSQSERKKQFLSQILPLVVNENKRIQKNREQMRIILKQLNQKQLISTESKQWLKQLAKKYRISGDILSSTHLQNDLLKRVNGISPAMALAQAANESAWGTSRFSKQGNNLFGIWTYNEKIGIKPLRREPGKKHFVRKFSSFQESVIVYIHTLNTHPAYKKLRDIRHQAVLKGNNLSGYELARGLEKYSAKGHDYIKMIQTMIDKNNLESLSMEASRQT